MRLSICVVFATLCQGNGWAMPESWSEAIAKYSTVTSGGQASDKKGAKSSGNLRQADVQEHHSKNRMHLKSVLASEVGIVHKTEYWGKIYVGTPAKEFTVIFDTGSGNLILPSTKCKSVACNSHEKYDPTKSTSGVQIGKHGKSLRENPDQKSEATIKFGTGKIHGQFYQDQLCLAEENACYKSNFIGTDYESEMPFDQCSFDGIMGLGFKDLSMGDGFNMVDDVVAQHSLPSNKFSVFLRDDDTGSQISFGGYKVSQAASDVLWAPVTRESYWQIAIDDVTFNNKKTGLCSNCQVAVDTGTSLLAGPSDVVEAFGEKLDLKMDCSNFNTLPMLGFALGDKVLNLKPEDYTDRASNGKLCSLALMTLDVPPPKGPLFIFGDPFLRRFLTVYDRDGPRVGFAVAQHKGVTRKEAEILIADLDDGTKKPSPKKSESDDDEDMDLIKVKSSIHEVQQPVDADTDPLKVVENENLSWNSMFKGMEGSGKRTPQQTGMLQQTTREKEANLVTISLARSNGKRYKGA